MKKYLIAYLACGKNSAILNLLPSTNALDDRANSWQTKRLLLTFVYDSSYSTCKLLKHCPNWLLKPSIFLVNAYK